MIILVAVLIFNTFLSLSCFLRQTATALTTSERSKHTCSWSVKKTATFSCDHSADFRHSGSNTTILQNTPVNETNVPAPTWWLFSLLFLFLNQETRRTPLPVYFSSPEKQTEKRKEEVYSQSPNWSQASPPPTCAHVALPAVPPRCFVPIAQITRSLLSHLHSN